MMHGQKNIKSYLNCWSICHLAKTTEFDL